MFNCAYDRLLGIDDHFFFIIIIIMERFDFNKKFISRES